MFTYKNEYYLFIENTSQLNPTQIKIRNKFNIIYRNNNNNRENLTNLKKFKNLCTKSGVKFFIANKAIDMIKVNADGLYISAHNKNLNLAKFKNSKYQLIGAAHNIKEINLKIRQGCKKLIFSRLFKTSYKNKQTFYGVIKFNNICRLTNLSLIPLGGIELKKLNSLNNLASNSFAVLSAIKKKPASFISRLF